MKTYNGTACLGLASTFSLARRCFSNFPRSSFSSRKDQVFRLPNETKFLYCPIYSPNSRFLVQETFPKTLPRFVLILISLQRWQHIGPQFLANQHETNQHKRAALIGLFQATYSVLLSVESYRNCRKPTQRGILGYLSSLQRRVCPIKQKVNL